jgi:hypothetical protein
MTNEALRIADLLDRNWEHSSELDMQAACELRRQHNEIKRLHEVKQELLKALKWIADVNAMDYEYQRKARATLSATQE